MKIDNFKRAFIISDTHLGYKNNRKAGDYKYKNENWQWYPL